MEDHRFSAMAEIRLIWKESEQNSMTLNSIAKDNFVRIFSKGEIQRLEEITSRIRQTEIDLAALDLHLCEKYGEIPRCYLSQ